MTQAKVSRQWTKVLTTAALCAMVAASPAPGDAQVPQGKAFDLTASRPYLNSADPSTDTQGRARIVYWPATSPRKGVLVSAGGFNPSRYVPDAAKEVGIDRIKLYRDAWDLGFDVYEINWYDGADFIQRNAFVLMELIERIQSGAFGSDINPGALASQEKFLLAGASMGGLVARYCLVYMEHEKIPHRVNTLFTNDTPHSGAYIPIGLQYLVPTVLDSITLYAMITTGSPVTQFQAIVDGVRKPAPRQMLLFHYTRAENSTGPPHDRLFDEFFADLKDKGDYPKTVRKVAVASGRGDGQPDETKPKILHWKSRKQQVFSKDFDIPYLSGSQILWYSKVNLALSADLEVQVWPLRPNSSDRRVFKSQFKLYWTLNGVAFDPFDVDTNVAFVKKALGVPDWVPVEFLLKPVLDAIAEAAKAELKKFTDAEASVNSGVAYEFVPGGWSDKTQATADLLKNTGSVSTVVGRHVFVPTVSALGLDVPPDTDLQNSSSINSPFDQIHCHNKNFGHVDLTDEDWKGVTEGEHVREWFRQELYILLGRPFISTLSPSFKTSGQREFDLTVQGVNFKQGAVVLWNGMARSTRFVRDTQLIASIPATDIGAPGDAKVMVRNPDPDEKLRSSNEQVLTMNANPVLVSPALPTTGDRITIGFSADWNTTCIPGKPTVSITGHTINLQASSSGGICGFAFTGYTLGATVGPLSAGDYEVILSNRVGTQAPQELGRRVVSVIHEQPVVSSLSQSEVSAASGGLTLVVHGSGFINGASSVLWNGSLRPTTFASSAELTVTIPAADLALSGTASLSVRTAPPGGGLSGSLPLIITAAKPVLSSLSPTSLVAGSAATVLVVSGNHFTSQATVQWVGSGGLTKSLATRFVSNSRLEVTLSPSDLSTAGAYPVTVLQNDNHTSPLVFLVESLNPASKVLVSEILPRSGSTQGGTLISLFGSGFTPEMLGASPDCPFKLGGNCLVDVTFMEGTQIDAILPPGSPGTVPLTISIAGAATAASPLTFNYQKLSPVPAVEPGKSRQRIPFVVDSAQFRSNLGINNLGSEPAQVDVLLVNANGELRNRLSQTVPPSGMVQTNHVMRALEQEAGMTNRRGLLILESSGAVVGWASQIDNGSADPSLQQSRKESQSASRVIIPSSASTSAFLTSLVVVNNSPLDGRVNIRSFRANDGVVQAEMNNLALKANGFLAFDDFYKKAGLNDVFGPIEVEAAGGIQISATARIYTRDRTGGYFEGVDANSAARQVVMPYTVDTADFRTNLGITNPGNSEATVIVFLRDKNGLSLGSRTVTVPARGLTQMNNINRQLLGSSDVTSLEGTLKLESNEPIIGWTSQIDNLTADLSLVVGKSAGAPTLWIPSTTSAGGFKSTLVVVNLSAVPTTIRILPKSLDGVGSISRDVTLPGNGFVALDDILGEMGQAGTFGPMQILSLEGGPIQAVSRVYSGQRTSGYFEGVPAN